MTAPLVPPAAGWSWGGPKGIRIALRLPPEQALDQVVSGLLTGRRFRLKERTSPTSARLSLGRASGIFLLDFSLLIQVLPHTAEILRERARRREAKARRRVP